MPLEALYPTISEQIVPPMAVAEAQGVILYFFLNGIFYCRREILNSNRTHSCESFGKIDKLIDLGASSVTFKKLESSMFKRRRKIQPRLPSCEQEFGVLLLESGYSTNHFKTVIQEDDVALIFGSDSMVNKLPDFTHIQFDGTFKLIPRLFLQLFTIFVEFNGHTLPALHILMTRKTEQLYTAVLSSIRELIPCFIPVFAIRDFEIAPRNALKGIYPTVTIIGCWFHYTKALYEKVQKLGLTLLYMKNHSFRKWIRRLMALPWLPEEKRYTLYTCC